MKETPTAHLHFDPPWPGLVGGTLLEGWLVAKPGHHFTDVRVTASGSIFPGILGFPRRDLAEFFKSDRRFLLAGFSITIHLPAGRHRLTLEACTVAGTWERIDAIERDITHAEAEPDPEPRAPVDAHACGEMLSIILRRHVRAGESLSSLARAVVAETPPRHHLQHPPRPLHGHLDQPRIWAQSDFGRLSVTGWIFHEVHPIRRVFVTTDLLAMQDVVYGRATPFLSAHAHVNDQALHAGYDGFLDLPTQLPRPTTVRLYVELEDGSWHLGSVARFAAIDEEFVKLPLPFSSPFVFIRAWRHLLQEINARGWQMPAGDLRHTRREAWRHYATFAPPAKPDTIALNHVRTGHQPSGTPPHIHLITHNLAYEGAPLFLLEYACALHTTGARLTVISAAEGPLRNAFTTLGADLHVIDVQTLFDATNATALRQALSGLGSTLNLATADLVVVNTLSCYWGVHLAHLAGRPSLFYIHESTPPRRFFHGLMPGGTFGVIEESFRLAHRVSFLTTATQRYYVGLSPQSQTCVNPGWIDLSAINCFRRANSRTTLRAAFGISSDRRRVINVGTLCERKGQHVFVRAVELLWLFDPVLAATTDFVMIGGRDTAYDHRLQHFIAGLHRPNLHIIPASANVYAHYMTADLFVCTSYEESFPRVVLEAMAFALPMICTAVHGIPEIARDGAEAVLVPPGDTVALCQALCRLLRAPDLGQQLAQAARARVAAKYDSAKLLPRHIALAKDLMTIKP